MSSVGGQKLKILVEYEILMKYSDETHQINASKMIEYLKKEDIPAERKSIYKDMSTIADAGIDLIKGEKGYYIGTRIFELAELKLLVDAVGASKFISEKKSKDLMQKIGSLASESEARQLSRQVVVPDRVTTENEKIFYTIDVIYQCIDADRQMSFQYEEWNMEKKKELRHGGEKYIVSPAFLIRNDENYYLVAYSESAREIRHFRLDKIVSAQMLEEERGGYDERKALNPDEYAKLHVNMFSGQERVITIKAYKRMVGVLLDKFGTDISVRGDGENFLKARVSVAVSPLLYGWLTGIGAVIVAPNDVSEDFKGFLEKQLELFNED